MTSESSTLQELWEVALALEAELARTRARIATLTDTEARLDHDLQVIRETIEILRQRRGLTGAGIEITDQLRERFRHLTPKEMAVEFARLRGNRLLIREAAPTLAAMGVFKDARNAASNLVTQVGRSIEKGENLFRRIRRGEYELISAASPGGTPEASRSDSSRLPMPDHETNELDDLGVDPSEWGLEADESGEAAAEFDGYRLMPDEPDAIPFDDGEQRFVLRRNGTFR